MAPPYKGMSDRRITGYRNQENKREIKKGKKAFPDLLPKPSALVLVDLPSRDGTS